MTDADESWSPQLAMPRLLAPLLALALTPDDIAAAVRVPGVTLTDWWAGRSVPSPTEHTRLLRLSAVGRALLGHVAGEQDAITWLRSGEPSALDLLRAGQQEQAELAIADLLFAQSAVGVEPWAAYRPDLDADDPA